MSESYKPDSAVNHHCRGCVFALGGGVQTGCSAGRLEVLAEKPGTKIEAVTDPPGVPDRREYFAIDGSYCFYKRQPPWEGTPDDARGEMRSRMTFRLVVVAGTPDVSAARKTVESARGFAAVSVVEGDDPPPRAEVVTWLRGQNTPWAVAWSRDGKLPWGTHADDEVRSAGELWYVLAHAGVALPEDLPDRIRSAVVDRDRVFLAVEGEGWYAMQTRIHREVGGFRPEEAVDGAGRFDHVLAKLRHVAADRGEKYVFAPGEVLS